MVTSLGHGPRSRAAVTGRGAQVALSHEGDPDFGGVLYARDEWLVFADAAGPVCLTTAHVCAYIYIYIYIYIHIYS